jgi:hypothetical protein
MSQVATSTTTMTRRQEIVKSCARNLMVGLLSSVKQEKQLYNRRNYAQGKMMSPKDYFYLRLEEFMTHYRLRMLRLGIGDEWITELLEKNFTVCRKNSRGHQGVSRKH